MSDSTDTPDDDSASDEEPKDKNALEWSVTIAGGLIVASVIAFFVYELIAGASGPVDLEVTLGTPSVEGAVAFVPIEVVNDGQRVAELAVVEVCAGEACSDISFDYIPYKSKVTGTVGLEAPLRAPLTSRIVSFRDP